MIEAGVIIDQDDHVLHWHRPFGATVGSLPDSDDLWNVIWEFRGYISGFAHSHPGGGIPTPSHCDVTTFSAIERALGKRLKWWITSSERVALYRWVGPGKYDYDGGALVLLPGWAPQLRHFSDYYYNQENGNDNSIDDNNQ